MSDSPHHAGTHFGRLIWKESEIIYLCFHSPVAILYGSEKRMLVQFLFCVLATSPNPTPPSPVPLLRFSNVHGDGMVLQSAPYAAQVWGLTGSVTDTVVVTFNNVKIQANVSLSPHNDGNVTWSALLPPTPASYTSYSITAATVAAAATLHDVLFGDVWVCSGQSNM